MIEITVPKPVTEYLLSHLFLPDNELKNYLVDLESLSEDIDAVQYWLSREPQYTYTADWLLVCLQHLLLNVHSV